MNCCLKKEEYRESLLKDIELQPYTIEPVYNDEKIKYIEPKKLPWQFFLDTHTHRDDIGWWKNRIK
tara:strand:- start:299 stop:496 length:198 start_codon:yes stop_codon:yes gene_type:complete